jgi:glycosyltransferase involved in cell wall biosynthesis
VVGDAGLIVPQGNAGALAEALTRLYGDPQLRADLGRRGRKRVLQRFTHACVAQLTYAAYERALGS